MTLAASLGVLAAVSFVLYWAHFFVPQEIPERDVEWIQAYPSPDGKYTATLEYVDNGLGFGMGAVYDEVHLTRTGQPVGEHGNAGDSVVFNARSTEQEVKVAWIDSRHLRVQYSREQSPDRALGRLDDVAIELLPMQ